MNDISREEYTALAKRANDLKRINESLLRIIKASSQASLDHFNRVKETVECIAAGKSIEEALETIYGRDNILEDGE